MEGFSKEAKCVVWDLDNTIWDGVLLEDGNVTLKDGVKEIIEELDSRGIMNSISSKNNHEDAIGKLHEFGLGDYFLYPEINWNAKSSSIDKIQKALNVGINTFIFVDDQPFERDEVSSVLKQVETYDALGYQELLQHPRLNPKFITEDSKRRRLMYQEDIKRKVLEADFEGPQEDFLRTLEMDFLITAAKEEDLKRAEELTQRTHQLNSTGITFDYDELDELRKSENHNLYISELTDKYGSYGKIGLALVDKHADHWHLRLMLMSCRVMSRGVGTVMLYYIMNEAKAAGKKLIADFQRTDRNRMMYVTYKFANFKEVEKFDDGRIVFENDLSMIPSYPQYINVETDVKLLKQEQDAY